MSCHLMLSGVIEITPGKDGLLARRSLDQKKIVATICSDDCRFCAMEIFPECKEAKNILLGKKT